MDKIEEVLTRGVEKIYPSKAALEKILRSGKKLRLYQGFDPSMPNLTIGHLVGILKLKKFQDLGHEVIFLVGDFTGMIGDPTDKSSGRQTLSRRQVLENCKNWKKQAGRVLDFKGKNPVKIMFNSQWLDKVTFKDLIEVTANFTVQQMIERDFFQRRIRERKPIFLHEFLYPVAQAIDCVQMNVDLEIGGTDQTFNMLAGRTLMKALKSREKFVLTTKLLVDSKGEKVGKTAGNALFLNASPKDMYGEIMSFPDETILSGFELLTEVSLEKIKKLEREFKKGKINPMDLKKQLAFEIVKMYHNARGTKLAEKEFERVFQKRKTPVEVEKLRIKNKELNIIDLLMQSKLVQSRSEAKRLIEQGGVEIDGKKLEIVPRSGIPLRGRNWKLEIKDGIILRVGKRRFRKLITDN